MLRSRGPALRTAPWIATWIGVGVLVAVEARDIADLGRTVQTAGLAVERSAEALRALDAVPVVWPKASARAREAAATARQAQRSGRASRRAIERLSARLGVVVAVVPNAPLLWHVVPRPRDRR